MKIIWLLVLAQDNLIVLTSALSSKHLYEALDSDLLDVEQ